MKLRNYTRIKEIYGWLLLGLTLGFLILPQKGYVMPVDSQDKISLEEAFHRIGEKFDVFFNYDRSIASNFTVEYEESQHHSLDDAIEYVLKNTNLGYRIFDQRFVVVFQNNDQGIESLKEMIGHVQGFVDERETVRMKHSRPVAPLLSLTVQEVYKKQLVFDITGTVVDESGEPLIGVNIQVKGTNKGTSTDFNGNFTLEDIDEQAVLVVSYIGYQTVDVSVSGKSNLTITLESDSQLLDEVVVVGYGTQKKSDLTGSVSSVAGKELTHLSTQRVDQALHGRAAGVMVRNTDASPGGNTIIRIRGMNSISGSNEALIVIDGLAGGDLNSLNPQDIASIEVLKDASATSIYGSRGSNGVILITTKNGQKGKPHINYAYTVTAGNLARKIPLLNAAEYARNRNERWLADDRTGVTRVPWFSEAQIDSFANFGGTDWQDELYNTAITQNHQIGVSGGSDNLNYFVSAGYLDQPGIMLNTEFKRYSIRAKVDAKITEWSSFGLNWNGAKMDRKGQVLATQVGSASRDALYFPPTVSVFDPSGNYNLRTPDYVPNKNTINPVATAWGTDLINGTIMNNLNAHLEFTPLEGLTLKIMGGAILSNHNNTTNYNLDTWIGRAYNGDGIIETSKNIYYQNSNILTYDKTLDGRHKDDHKFTVTLAQEQSQSSNSNSSIEGWEFVVPQTNIHNISGAKNLLVSSGNSKRVLISYLGRINYSFSDKYLLTASYRADGSSVFGDNNKWGYFPSVAVAWRASEESFIKRIKSVSNLKFRGSYGVTGSQALSPYATLASISSGRNYNYEGGKGESIGYIITGLGNPNLKWESTSQFNGGFDMGLFNNRVTFTADYYSKLTSNLLLSRRIPGYVGLTSIIDNVGSISNKGAEFSIGGDPLVGNFKWNTNFNISFNRGKVVSLGQTKQLGYSSGGSGFSTNAQFMYLVPGQPYGQMYGWIFEGLWKTSEAEEAAVYGQMPGDPRYFDKNHDGRIDQSDTTVMGNSMPKYTFGWNNQVSYKSFDLSFIILGSVGHDIFNVENVGLMGINGEGTSKKLLNRWTPENQNTDVPAIIKASTRQDLNLPPSTLSFPSSSSNVNSRWLEDGSYARLKSVMLTYHFAKDIINKLKFSNLSVYLSGSNLITLTKYSGYDPEASAYTRNDAQLGSEFGNYPQQRTFSLGLNLTF